MFYWELVFSGHFILALVWEMRHPPFHWKHFDGTVSTAPWHLELDASPREFWKRIIIIKTTLFSSFLLQFLTMPIYKGLISTHIHTNFPQRGRQSLNGPFYHGLHNQQGYIHMNSGELIATIVCLHPTRLTLCSSNILLTKPAVRTNFMPTNKNYPTSPGVSIIRKK